MKQFDLHIASGRIVVIDPMFVNYAQTPSGKRVKPFHENDLFLTADGFEKLLALQSIAMGQSEMDDELDAIGYYDLTPIEAGTFIFALEDIRRVKSDTKVDKTKQFSVDSGQILVFDADYLDGVLKHFSWKHAYKKNQVDRTREREHGQLIASRDDVYVQVQSPGVNRGVAFVGDGEYYFRDGAFKPATT